MGKIVAFMNNKGGVGKTITTHSVGIACDEYRTWDLSV